MALILNIETSTNVCSVCISKNGEVLGLKESSDEKSHAKLLTIFIDQLLKDSNINIEELDAVAISKGPGSYTGLRIGVSTAKGLCYAKDIPLIAISTLDSMANGIVKGIEKGIIKTGGGKDIVLVPMLDARRMEVYSACYNHEGIRIRDVQAEIIDENSYQDILKDKKVIFFGNGSEKIKTVINHHNAIYVDSIYPSSKDMIGLAETAIKDGEFEDAAYFEPFYLKDFIATVPKKNIFK